MDILSFAPEVQAFIEADMVNAANNGVVDVAVAENQANMGSSALNVETGTYKFIHFTLEGKDEKGKKVTRHRVVLGEVLKPAVDEVKDAKGKVITKAVPAVINWLGSVGRSRLSPGLRKEVGDLDEGWLVIGQVLDVDFPKRGNIDAYTVYGLLLAPDEELPKGSFISGTKPTE